MVFCSKISRFFSQAGRNVEPRRNLNAVVFRKNVHREALSNSYTVDAHQPSERGLKHARQPKFSREPSQRNANQVSPKNRILGRSRGPAAGPPPPAYGRGCGGPGGGRRVPAGRPRSRAQPPPLAAARRAQARADTLDHSSDAFSEHRAFDRAPTSWGVAEKLSRNNIAGRG